MVSQPVVEIYRPETDEAYDLPETANNYFAGDAETDFATRRRLMKTLGSITVSQAGEISSKRELTERASLPNVAEDYFSSVPERAANAKARLRMDLKGNVFEILFESGHVRVTYSHYDQDGFYQNGYNQSNMYAYATAHTSFAPENHRRSLETLNELRIEDGFLDGRFKTHMLVEISLAPDDMPDEDAEELGYKTKTRKGMWRCTEVDEFGNRITFTAPVVGVNERGDRHDKKAVQHVYNQFGLKSDNISASATLGNAFWASKEQLPNRIVDVIKYHDEGLAEPSFFGRDGETGDYETIIEESLRREEQAEAELDQKVHKLALSLLGASNEEALKTMAIHAKDFAVELCRGNLDYDTSQLGPVAEGYINEARYYDLIGNDVMARQTEDRAKQTAIVYMCGMRLEMERSVAGTISEKAEVVSKDCDYISKECPLCHAKKAPTHETSTTITCRICKGSVKKKG
ncbi:MAG TPA: hypothetical protein VMR95_01190 [Candidatus Binatia bacterium]|nr:hypothetical protein [Candidatus Binatia bacterium]